MGQCDCSESKHDLQMGQHPIIKIIYIDDLLIPRALQIISDLNEKQTSKDNLKEENTQHLFECEGYTELRKNIRIEDTPKNNQKKQHKGHSRSVKYDNRKKEKN